MKNFLQSWGLLILALILGLVAFLLTNFYLSNKEQSLRDSILAGRKQTVQVVVATQDIPTGAEIGSSNMAIAEVEAEHVSAFAVGPNEFNAFEGQILKFPMSRGEPLLRHSVDGDLIDRFSELIDEGARAVTVEVDAISSNSGLLVVGDFVDVVVSGNFRNSVSNEKEQAYVPLFQRVKVLAIDRNPLLSRDQDFRSDLARDIQNPENRVNYDAITLAIDNEEANLLAFASEVGEIKFFLRNSEDEGIDTLDIITEDSITIEKETQTTGTYLYMSPGTQSQAVRVLQTLSDAVVNEDLRTTSFRKSRPISSSKISDISLNTILPAKAEPIESKAVEVPDEETQNNNGNIIDENVSK